MELSRISPGASRGDPLPLWQQVVASTKCSGWSITARVPCTPSPKSSMTILRVESSAALIASELSSSASRRRPPQDRESAFAPAWRNTRGVCPCPGFPGPCLLPCVPAGQGDRNHAPPPISVTVLHVSSEYVSTYADLRFAAHAPTPRFATYGRVDWGIPSSMLVRIYLRSRT